MGLFGYNKKKFNKNTQIFKSIAEKTFRACAEMSDDNSRHRISSVLCQLILEIERREYSDKNRGAAEFDAYLTDLFSRMDKCAFDKKYSYARCIAERIFEMLSEYNRYGRMHDNFKEKTESEFELNFLLADIQDLQANVEKIKEKMLEIEERSKTLPEDQWETLNNEYVKLESDKEAYEYKSQVLIQKYRAMIEIENLKKNIELLEKFEPLQYEDLSDDLERYRQLTKKEETKN